ncbi:MAG: membrane protein insertase YidC [Spirochaetales bacterium]|jgi:YidC/Oxa1 family membrane protein insertase|nr:membrane protein insertase YidC [Spirochaetales bacterium]
MDKRTLLAVVLSVVVISVGFMIQSLVSPPPEDIVPANAVPAEGVTADPGTVPVAEDTSPQTAEDTQPEVMLQAVAAAGETDERERNITIETDLLVAKFTNKGGELVSLLLKEHFDGDEPIDMVFKGESDQNAFFVNFGGPGAAPVNDIFEYSRRGEYGIEFRRDFIAPPAADGKAYPFTLIKRYTFEPGIYMFQLVVTIENSVNAFPNLDFNGIAYNLGFGPQIGPEFESLGGRGEYRYYYTYEDKRKTNRTKNGEIFINNRFVWAGIAGKYFALLVAPAGNYTLTYKEPIIDGIPNSSFMYLSRPPIKSSVIEDTYLVYAGPKLKKELVSFNDASENAFGASGLNLDAAVDSSALLGWLESILKFFLDLFYKVIPNYGVSIIILSIFIKLIFFPITKKSFESTAKMQALNPKITELKAKYKDKPQQMNQEMAALYKREKVNPLGGCLPIVIQMPIFIAFYGVLSKHFALRGAPFFWWITDLSEPDSILNFGAFTLPLLGWNDLRLLPILYVGTQLISSKLMQTPQTSTSKNMKMMQYMMPIFFFFILYSAPSGLLLYWTLTNVFTAIQQKGISSYRKTHKAKEKPDDDKKSGPSKKRK